MVLGEAERERGWEENGGGNHVKLCLTEGYDLIDHGQLTLTW